MWACWCHKDYFHQPYEIACIRCGRLHPPRNIRKVYNAHPSSDRRRPVKEIKYEKKEWGCMPNPETIKANY